MEKPTLNGAHPAIGSGVFIAPPPEGPVGGSSGEPIGGPLEAGGANDKVSEQPLLYTIRVSGYGPPV
ncbi:MAG: hypothetical protein ACKPB3_09115, partial [Bacteroidota bacterium]